MIAKAVAASALLTLLMLTNERALAQSCVDGVVSDVTTTSTLAVAEITNYSQTAEASIWRQACATDTSKSAVLMRFDIRADDFFVCGDFVASQSGYQFDRVVFRNFEEGGSVCADITESKTFLVEISAGYGTAAYDDNVEFRQDDQFALFYEDGADVWEFQVPAYSPSSSGSHTLSMALEEPTNASSATGVSNIRGWAVSSSGINRLELFINGNFISEIPYGGNRGDVEGAFPDITDSINSGFGQTFNYGLLGQGEHSMTVRAYANNGELIEKTSLFEVVSFRESFIAAEGYPDLSEAQVFLDQNTGKITIANVVLEDGSTYDVVLQWRKATQGFEIVEVLEFVVD